MAPLVSLSPSSSPLSALSPPVPPLVLVLVLVLLSRRLCSSTHSLHSTPCPRSSLISSHRLLPLPPSHSTTQDGHSRFKLPPLPLLVLVHRLLGPPSSPHPRLLGSQPLLRPSLCTATPPSQRRPSLKDLLRHAHERRRCRPPARSRTPSTKEGRRSANRFVVEEQGTESD